MVAHIVIVGRVLLDLFFKEPLHDTYSIIVGIHALTFLSFAYRFVKRRIQLFIRYRRSLSTYALGANPAKEVISVLIKKTLHLILLAINGAVVLPLLVGFATHFYIFIPLGMAFGNNVAASTSTRTDDDHQASSLSSALAEISILMTWCYGVVITNLVCQVATGVMKENWMSIFLDQVSYFHLYLMLWISISRYLRRVMCG